MIFYNCIVKRNEPKNAASNETALLLDCSFGLTRSHSPLFFCAIVERLPPGRGRGVLPYKGLMGACGQPGYVFRDFCLKQGIDFINFCLNQSIDFINFCLKQGIFSWTINILRMFYELNYSKIFIYYFLTQGMVSG